MTRIPSFPAVALLVRQVIERVADKWTMLEPEEHGTLRFSRLSEMVGGIGQKMLTKTVRQMEADWGRVWARRFAASGSGRRNIKWRSKRRGRSFSR